MNKFPSRILFKNSTLDLLLRSRHFIFSISLISYLRYENLICFHPSSLLIISQQAYFVPSRESEILRFPNHHRDIKNHSTHNTNISTQ